MATSKKPRGPLPPKPITRGQAAERLSITVSGVRGLERDGRLKPRVRDGVHYFEVADVDAARAHVMPRPKPTPPIATTSGERASQAFELLARGYGWRDLVRQLALDPAEAQALASSFEADDDVRLSRELVARLRVLIGGPVTGATLEASWRRLLQQLRAARAALPPSARQVQPSRDGAPAAGHRLRDRHLDEA